MPLLDSLEERKRQSLMDMLAEMTSKPQPVTDPALRQQFPKTYGFLGGAMGTAPDQFEGSVLDPQSAQVRAGAEMSFYPGALAQMVGGLPMKSAQIGKAAVRGLDNLAQPSPFNLGTRGQGGAIVYHGSPHKFDKFDSSKIGTGEGAQAYGHGLYLAENPSVAKAYAEQLSTPSGPSGDVAKYWRANGGEPAFRAFAKDAGLDAREIENAAQGISNAGNHYKVDLPDEHIAKMLDWDKPLSQQSKEVQKSLAPLMDEWAGKMQKFNPSAVEQYRSGTMEGRLINSALGDGSANSSADALQKAGITGIRYLDGGSRAGGKGTSNYVVFPSNEGLLNIMERNGESLNQLNKFVYPQGKALETAQRNAALPVEQGGLGLPVGNTPMDRAASMGFDINSPQFHATDKEFASFIPSSKGKLGAGVYVSPSSKYAEKYVGENARVLPLVSRGKMASDDESINIAESIRNKMYAENPNFSVPDWKRQTTKAISDAGYAGREFNGLESVITDPANIRSRFAAFDPMRRNEDDLLAGAIPFLATDEEQRKSLMQSLGY